MIYICATQRILETKSASYSMAYDLAHWQLQDC